MRELLKNRTVLGFPVCASREFLLFVRFDPIYLAFFASDEEEAWRFDLSIFRNLDCQRLTTKEQYRLGCLFFVR